MNRLDIVNVGGGPGWYEPDNANPETHDPAGIVDMDVEDFLHGGSVAHVTLRWTGFDDQTPQRIGVELTPEDCRDLAAFFSRVWDDYKAEMAFVKEGEA